VPITLAGVRHAATLIKGPATAADKYPVSRRVFRRTFAAAASLAALLALPVGAGAITPTPRITEFVPLTVANAPGDITAGPDGNLWFTEEGVLPGIGKITTSGAITEYSAGLASGFSLLMTPKGITEGPDGNLWFTEQGVTGDGVASLDPSTGAVTEYALGAGEDPTAITAGSDGNLWFLERGATKIGRITPAGVIDEFNAGLSGSDTLNDITSGPDGQLWVTIASPDGDKIESFSPSNPDDPCFWSTGLTGTPNQIVTASDDKLYFTESGDPAAIGRIKTDGAIREYRTGLTADSAPGGLAEGNKGTLWFTGAASPGRIGRMNIGNHEFEEIVAGTGLGIDLTPDAAPAGITRGPDGNMWFTESGLTGKIGRVYLGPTAELWLDDIQFPGKERHEITNGVIKATVGANSQDTTYHLEYGPDDQYGTDTEEQSAGHEADPMTENVELPLEPSSHYHARLVATNGAGETASPDLELWTDQLGRISDFDPTVPEVGPVPTVTPAPTPKPANGNANGTGHAPEGLPAPAAGTPAADVAPPVLGKQVVVRPVGGKVKIKAPGAKGYRTLAAGAQLPVGTVVDTRAGKIVLQSARDRHGRTQKGTFWGGVFQIRQKRTGKGMTDLILRGGGFSRCGTRAGVSVLAREAKGKRRVVRRLWGRDSHSRFRTHGRDSVATVRGTRWITTDRCDGTLTSVTQGKVLVRDLHRKRSVMVRAGSAYLARHHRR
jgi:streptogramin lyase